MRWMFILFTCLVISGCSGKAIKPLPVVKDTRRTDFIMGCITGASSIAEYYRIKIKADATVTVCKTIFDTHKDKINEQLDLLDKNGI